MATRSETYADSETRRPRVVSVATTETKNASKTTEFYAMVAIVAGILVAAWWIGRNGAPDAFRADRAWLLISIVGSAYMVSRGLAKSGSREAYRDDNDR